jgi:methylmalonyl-CoA mutase N-terminal domain/subunit
MGGMLHAIEIGYVQREIQEAAYQYQKAVETDTAVVVGVNRFRAEEETAVPTLRIDPTVERTQVERVRALRERRDAERTEVSLTLLEDAARSSENLLPRILSCVESLATVGEISNRLRHVWGEYREAVTV